MNNSETVEQYSESEIAIIGMAGRFPQAKNTEQFWQNLRDGLEAISPLTDEEVLAAGVDPSLLDDPRLVKASAALDEIELFDAAFFGINPREAEIMDPQHRFFLECAWEALENAGYDAERYRGVIGVFAGVSMSTYLLNLYSNRDLLKRVTAFQIMLGNEKDYLTTRVSYKLNLKGPSLNVQTSCSTSLVSLHLAIESLLSGGCDMALAGGVSIKTPQKTGYLFQEGGINSPDGHCRAFDAKAQGTLGGNGVGIVIVKRLADAVADGDNILAVIKGSAINNDGALKVGFTAPGVEGQSKVIAEALALADVDPETITYIETHGTGTTLGDPVEIAALTKAFRAHTAKKSFCAIASVKTNIGHLDAAAGIAGLIKTILSLQHKMIPPNLHFTEPNPKINFADSPFYVNATLSDWKNGETPRRAGVSSFGIGGTNMHVILEEAPLRAESSDSRPWQLLLLSARTKTALETATTNLAAYLLSNTETKVADLAYTLQVGRKVFEHRRATICKDVSEGSRLLTERNEKSVWTSVQRARTRPLAFMFSGQGTQYVNMGLQLYRSEKTFHAEIDRCAQILSPHLGFDLREALYPEEAQVEAARQRLNQTSIAQPALFVTEYALAKLWMFWGVRPQALIGHSIGEYVAACLAGVFSLEEALSLVAARGRLMQQLPAGTMLAVHLKETEVTPLLNQQLSLAAVNGPDLFVISGETKAVDEMDQQLKSRGVTCLKLHTSHAFHSQMMEPILDEFTKVVRTIDLKPPQIPYISNVKGSWITAAEATQPEYWARHARQTVRFGAGLAELLKEPEQVLLEIGPGQTLRTLAQRHPARLDEHAILNSLQPAKGKEPEEAYLLKALAQLWLAGIEVNWQRFSADENRQRLPLPPYPFERQRYWVGRSETFTAPADSLNGPQPNGNNETDGKLRQEQRPPAPSQAPALPGQGTQHIVAVAQGESSGPAASNGAANPVAPGDEHERIIAQQLQVMARQLELLRKRG
ncbi:MAG: type I polyketide synthase [Acidobacteriota bacterium]